MGKKRYKGRQGKTDAEAAQDIRFADAMQCDMEEYSRDAENRHEDYLKDNLNYDGKGSIEAGADDFSENESARQALMGTLYMPYLGGTSVGEDRHKGAGNKDNNKDKTK